MLNVISRILAILIVASALVTATNYAVNTGAIGGRGGHEHEEHHEHRERDDDPTNLTNQYPALGVVTGLLPTVIKIVGLGIVTVQVGNVLNRRRRARRSLA
jgi:ABC-type cobalt transport system substrate-binding protein